MPGETARAAAVNVFVMVGLQLLLTCVPLMNRLFHTALLDGAARVPILATAMVAYLFVGFEIWIRRRLTATRSGASRFGEGI